jgi:hypothetical protein
MGFCACIDNWTGDDCSIPGYSCDDSCHDCWGPLDIHCDSCYDGYALTRTYTEAEVAWFAEARRDFDIQTPWEERDGEYRMCKLCQPGCKACAISQDENVTDADASGANFEIFASRALPTETYCTTCYAGWYWVPTGEPGTPAPGTCEPCHISCAACTGPGVNECLYCFDDRELKTGISIYVHGAVLTTGDFCICKEGTVSDNFMVCFSDCPIAMEIVEGGFCTAIDSANQLSLGAHSTGLGENTREYGWWTPTGYNTQPLCRSA